MDKDFVWKPYIIGSLALIVILAIFNYKFALGALIGTIIYFINDRLNLKKFPKLDANSKAIFSMLSIMFTQGILTIGAGIGSYFIGGIGSVISCFAAQIIPSLYFIIVGAKK